MSPSLFCPRRFADTRGWFSETWNDARLKAQGVMVDFCQDNQSYSAQTGQSAHLLPIPTTAVGI